VRLAVASVAVEEVLRVAVALEVLVVVALAVVVRVVRGKGLNTIIFLQSFRRKPESQHQLQLQFIYSPIMDCRIERIRYPSHRRQLKL
jgi:hypothetical protein